MDPTLLTDRAWIWLGAACYAAGFLHGCLSLLRRRRHSRWLMFTLVGIGFLLQTIGLYRRGMATGGCPLGNAFELVQFTIWSCTLLYLVVGPAFRMSLLGFFCAGLTASLSVLSLLAPGLDTLHRTRYFGISPWIEVHAAVALFSYGVFGLLALTSVMYLLQVRNLQRRQAPALFGYLPSVVELDTMNLRLLGFGVALLTASLAVGGHYFRAAPEHVDPIKLAATVSLWAAYLVVLGLRLRHRLMTVRFAWVCVILFALSLVSLGPVNASRRAAAHPAAAQR